MAKRFNDPIEYNNRAIQDGSAISRSGVLWSTRRWRQTGSRTSDGDYSKSPPAT
jgi:hypothetical protein